MELKFNVVLNLHFMKSLVVTSTSFLQNMETFQNNFGFLRIGFHNPTIGYEYN